jgi:plasmid stability protein
MDTLIRNIDAPTYRAARARAALEGRSVGEVVTEALRDYLARNPVAENPSTLLDQPEASPDEERPGTPVDEVVFLYCI